MKPGKKTESIDFNTMRPDKLADYIVNTHHRFIKNALTRFEVHLKTILKVDGAKHPEVMEVDGLVKELKLVMEQHLQLEEHILFPYIRKLIERSGNIEQLLLENPINKVKLEHSLAQKILQKIRRLSNNYVPPDNSSPALKLCYAQLFDFEQDIHKHIFLEESILFPKLLGLEKQLLNKH